MADKWPLATGNWSNAANWNGGTKPVDGDVVYADGKTVTIDENITVASIRTSQRSGGTIGGGFNCNISTTITADILAGSSVCLTLSGGLGNSITINGSINGGGPGANVVGVRITGNNSVLINGNVTGGTVGAGGNCYGVENQGLADVTINGNVTGGGGTGGGGNNGVSNQNGNMTINGNVTGGFGGSNGVQQAGASGVCNVNGNVTAGTGSGGVTANIGVANTSNGSVNIVGNVTSTGYLGVYNSSSGTVRITGNCYAGTRPPFFNALSTGKMIVSGDVIASSAGVWICEGVLLISPTREILYQVRTDNVGSAGFARNFYTGGTNLGQPIQSNVRYGTVYGAAGEYTGTCRVPSANVVLLGNLVDNTTGTLSVYSGISGDYPVSMTVEDDIGNPVSIKFNVLTSAGTMVGSSVTDTLGEEEFSLSTGDYKITFPLNHIYEDHADVTFSVGTSSVTIPTIVLQRKSLTPATDPAKTSVYFVLEDITGPIVNGSVEYQLDQNCFAEDIELSSKKHIVYSDADGIAIATMFRYSTITKGTGIYKITIKDSDGTVIHDVRRRIKTDQPAVYFEDLHD